jgi:hypothetical protein
MKPQVYRTSHCELTPSDTSCERSASDKAIVGNNVTATFTTTSAARSRLAQARTRYRAPSTHSLGANAACHVPFASISPAPGRGVVSSRVFATTALLTVKRRIPVNSFKHYIEINFTVQQLYWFNGDEQAGNEHQL